MDGGDDIGVICILMFLFCFFGKFWFFFKFMVCGSNFLLLKMLRYGFFFWVKNIFFKIGGKIWVL